VTLCDGKDNHFPFNDDEVTIIAHEFLLVAIRNLSALKIQHLCLVTKRPQSPKKLLFVKWPDVTGETVMWLVAASVVCSTYLAIT
jgi:hypothetical protein